MNHHDIRLIEIGQKEGYAKAVREIVAWLRDNVTPHNDIDEWADEIEAKFGGTSTPVDSDQAVRDEVKLIADWFWGMGMRQTASAIEDGDYKK